MSVAADLGLQATVRNRSQVRRHDWRCASKESKWRRCHPRHLDWDEIAKTSPRTDQQHLRNVRAVLGSFPLALIRAAYSLAVLFALGKAFSGSKCNRAELVHVQ